LADFGIEDLIMKSTCRYLIVKFVPDVRRMEPRNVGVFVTHPDALAARFMTGSQARFVDDTELYDRWVTFLSKISTTGQTRVRNKLIDRSDPDFFDAVASSGRGKYLLFDGGESLTPMVKREVSGFADVLFSELVLPQGEAEEDSESASDSPSFNSQCREILARAGLDIGKAGVHVGEKLECNIGPVTREFSVHYVLGTRSLPKAVFQRVDLCEPKSIDSASFMFEKLHENRVISKQRSVAFVRSNLHRPEVDGAHGQLKEYAEVVDVSKPSAAATQMNEFARNLSA
jgi:hypothetical protein